VAPGDIDELRVAPRGPDRSGVADGKDNQPGNPELQAEPDRACKGPISDRKPARRAAEQDVLGQRAVDRHHEAVGEIGHPGFHQTSAPPPNEKNERKKEEAAKAIDRPKTI
jgi:hypothetical protein